MRYAVLLAFSLFCSACAAANLPPIEHTGPKISGYRPLERSGLRVLTWNTGLAPGMVRWASPRRPAAMSALAKADADVICLQEVWTDEARDEAVAALRSSGYAVFTAKTAGKNESRKDTCDEDDLRPLSECVEDACGEYPDEDKGVCAVQRCRGELVELYLWRRRCLNCVLATIGSPTREVERRCVERSASRPYGGNNGMILASRLPIEEPEGLGLRSSGINRAALLARIRLPGGAAVEVGCVHFSSDQPMPPTIKRFDSWEDEIGYQLQAVSQRLEQRSGGVRPQLLAGDLNFAAADPPRKEAQMFKARLLADKLGFKAPAEWIDPPICSWCAGNSLTSAYRDQLIDQVLVRQAAIKGGRKVGKFFKDVGLILLDIVTIGIVSAVYPEIRGAKLAVLRPVAAWREMMSPTIIRDKRGYPVGVNLSDHYGICQDFDIVK